MSPGSRQLPSKLEPLRAYTSPWKLIRLTAFFSFSLPCGLSANHRFLIGKASFILLAALLLPGCAASQGPTQNVIIARQASSPGTVELPPNERVSEPIISVSVPPGSYVVIFDIYFYGANLSVDNAFPICQPFDATGRPLDFGRGSMLAKPPGNAVVGGDMTAVQIITIKSPTTVAIRCDDLDGGSDVIASKGLLILTPAGQ